MTIRQRQILWFFVIYALSLGSFALLALSQERYCVGQRSSLSVLERKMR
jgi:hypothetical protein